MIDRIEFPLDLDRERGQLGGLSLRELADMPFAKLSRWSTAGCSEPAKGEIAFWRESDPLWQACRTWALMQADLTGGEVDCHMFGGGDELFVSALRWLCEQPGVLVSATFEALWVGSFKDGNGALYGMVRDGFLDGRLGNSIVTVGDLGSPVAGRPDPLLARYQPGTERGETTFAATPPPGWLTGSAGDHPPTRPVSAQPLLVVGRRLALWEGAGMICVSERALNARRLGVRLGLDHRAARERQSSGVPVRQDRGYKAPWRTPDTLPPGDAQST